MVSVVSILILILYIILGLKKPAIALVTSPFMALTIFAAGIEKSSVAMITAPFIFIVTVMVVSVSKRESESQGWPQFLAKWILIISILILLSLTLSVILVAVNVIDSIYFFLGFAGLIGLIFFIVFIGTIVSFFMTSKNSTAAYILSTIGASMRQNLPLPMALESASAGRTDKHSLIMQKIKNWLVQGYSLSESIKRGYPKCPGHAIAMITATERIDQLPLAISAIEADIVAKADESRRIRPVHPIYPMIVIGITFTILMTVMKYVIPQFKSVLEETVGGRLPAATEVVLSITNFISNDFGWLMWWLLVFIILLLGPFSMFIKLRPRRPDNPYLISRIGDYLKWHLPFMHWYELNYSMVQVVEIMRLSLNAGYTVDDSIKNTLELDVNNCFRQRLIVWLGRVRRGDNISNAVRESKLGSTLSWAFDEKINQGNTLTILETLESFYRSNYSYYVNLARFIFWPCLTLLMGAMVGFVVYAIFSPGITVIRSLTGQVTP